MRVGREIGELGPGPRAVALGTFDGVHLGHRKVVEALLDAGPEPTVVTFDPHPRTALGNRVELLTTLDRRLELLEELGVEATLVVEFTLDVARLEPQEFAEQVLRPIGAETIVAGADFRFGRGRTGDLTLLEQPRLRDETGPDPRKESRRPQIRERARAGDVEGAAAAPRPAGRGRGHRRHRRRPRRNARLPDREPRRPPRAARARRTASTPARPSTTAPPSRSARTRTTEAANGASRRSCSTTRETSTASGSSSSSGAASATSAPSTARTSSSPRSPTTSSSRAAPQGPPEGSHDASGAASTRISRDAGPRDDADAAEVVVSLRPGSDLEPG